MYFDSGPLEQCCHNMTIVFVIYCSACQTQQRGEVDKEMPLMCAKQGDGIRMQWV